MTRSIRKLLVANRSEIAIRVFRTAHELGIRTVAVYSHEDRYALHRFKADEAYQVGKQGEPIRAYLDINGILDVAKQYRGRRHSSRLRLFVGESGAVAGLPRRGDHLLRPARRKSWSMLGDKLAARALAMKAKVPVLSGSNEPLTTADKAAAAGREIGISRAAQGGQRGRRTRHAGGQQAGRAGRRARTGAARVAGRIRQLRRLSGKIHSPPAAHRGAIAGRPARRLVHLVRARLLGAKAVSKGGRDRPGAEARRFAPRRDLQSRAADRKRGQVSERRHC